MCQSGTALVTKKTKRRSFSQRITNVSIDACEGHSNKKKIINFQTLNLKVIKKMRKVRL